MKYLISVVVLFLFSGSPFAQPFGSLDDMKAVCDHTPSGNEAKLIDATAFLVRVDRLSENSDGTYNVWNEPFTTVSLLGGGTLAVCTSSNFYGEPTARLGRTGVLIGSDTILTAPHANPFNPLDFAVIFRDKVGTTPCVGFHWSNIPAANVYFPDSASTTSNTYGLSADRYDFATFRLDRSVVGRKPIKIRRSGHSDLNDLIVLASHPNHTAMRFDTAGIYFGDDGSGDPLFFNLHPSAGSSGGALYNSKDDVIETVVSGGLQAGSGHDVENSCWYQIHVDFPTARRTNGRIADVENLVPRSEILVSPLDRIVHVVDIGGVLSSPVSTYDILEGSASGQFSVSSVTGDVYPGSPALSSSLSPGTYTIGSSGSANLSLSADISGVTQCGIWNMSLNVRDVTNDQDNVIRHRFEIGAKELAISDKTGLEVKRFSPPVGILKSIEVTNVRPTPFIVELSSDPKSPVAATPFQYRVNGNVVSSIPLGPAGSSTDSAVIDVSVDSALASALPRGQSRSWDFVVSIDDFVCSLTEDSVSPYTYIHGREEFHGFADGGLSPPGTPGGPELGAPSIVDVEVSGAAGQCVDEVELYVDFFQVPGYFGDIASEIEHMKIDLRSPSGVVANLWDRNTPSAGGAYFSYGHEVEYPGTLYPAQRLRLQDIKATPAGADLLSVFKGTTLVDGVWTLEIRASYGMQPMAPLQVVVDITKPSPLAACSP